jgi:1-aminocyclopropane-1-carboxylate deaminase
MDPHYLPLPSPLEKLYVHEWEERGVELYIKRDDLIHPWISGNKWRKLKYNLHRALMEKCSTLVTFGGAYSNHLVATAAAARLNGLESCGFIRSHQSSLDNPTVRLLRLLDMRLITLPPEVYKKKVASHEVRKVLKGLSKYHIIPEGGTNEDALEGVAELYGEIIAALGEEPDVICTALGSGGTSAGLVNACASAQVIGISPFKAAMTDFPGREFIAASKSSNFLILGDILGIAFAGFHQRIPEYINSFFEEHGILLDPIYTSRAMMTAEKMITEGQFRPGSKIVFVHTGGLQGIPGYNQRFGGKGKVIIPENYRYLATPSTILG